MIQKSTCRNIYDHSPFAPELSNDIHQVLPFLVNLSDPEFARSFTPNFSVSKPISPQLYKKK